MKRNWSDVVVLALLLAFSVGPMYLFASSLSDGDEFKKSALGIVATTVVAVYKLWSSGKTSDA